MHIYIYIYIYIYGGGRDHLNIDGQDVVLIDREIRLLYVKFLD